MVRGATSFTNRSFMPPRADPHGVDGDWCRPQEALEQGMGRLERCAMSTDTDSEEISEDLNAIYSR